MIAQLEDEVAKMERHLAILELVARHEPIGIVALADETGYPQHKVRYSLRVLEDGGLIEPTNQGAVTTDAAGEYVGEIPGRLDDIRSRLETMKARTRPLETH